MGRIHKSLLDLYQISEEDLYIIRVLMYAVDKEQFQIKKDRLENKIKGVLKKYQIGIFHDDSLRAEIYNLTYLLDPEMVKKYGPVKPGEIKGLWE